MENKMGKSKGRMRVSGESHHFVRKWWMSGVQEVYAPGSYTLEKQSML
jgi:hypothetical protein